MYFSFNAMFIIKSKAKYWQFLQFLEASTWIRAATRREREARRSVPKMRRNVRVERSNRRWEEVRLAAQLLQSYRSRSAQFAAVQNGDFTRPEELLRDAYRRQDAVRQARQHGPAPQSARPARILPIPPGYAYFSFQSFTFFTLLNTVADTDTKFGGVTAFPESSTLVTGLKYKDKYKGFKAQEKWPQFE